ncbi:zinc finger protein 813 [Mugil cephalus]|uniref:zinc finger protein 813 n=1 Tax=Mugil cephalus TaxID=48193 RepID=UPI001FB5FE7F|nr:zinc finger protein 813 [Mugil cephalus]
MSDTDTLFATFQTQLSDVMEAVLKTAMFKVTRLVEDVFLEEVKRRSQEVATLRMQLHWTESKFIDQGGKEGRKTGRCVDCARDDVELSADAFEEMAEGQQDDVLRGCSVKKEGDTGERWITSCRQDLISESQQEAENPAADQSPERKSQSHHAREEEDEMAAVDMKEEEPQPSYSSLHLGGWSGTLDDEAGFESDSSSEVTEAQETDEEILRTVVKQDPEISTAYGFSESNTQTATDQLQASALEIEQNSWAGLTVTAAGLLQNHRLGAETERDPVKSEGPVKCTEYELSDTARAVVQIVASRDHIPSSASPQERLQHGNTLGVTIKEEVVVGSDGDEESNHVEKKITKPGLACFSSSGRQQRLSSLTRRSNHISHKATLQDVMRLHSKVGAGHRLHAAIHHVHRPMKKPVHTFVNSSSASLAMARSQVGNLNLNRIPSTSKAAPTPAVQRVQRPTQSGNKQTSALHRTGVPWGSIRSHHHSANSPQGDAAAYPDSHAGPRHLLCCGQCGKCFPHPSNLKAHLQTHTGERPFCCSLCGRSFTKLSNLKAHRRVHTGERPYCCSACGKCFTQKCNLKRHQRIHLDV